MVLTQVSNWGGNRQANPYSKRVGLYESETVTSQKKRIRNIKDLKHAIKLMYLAVSLINMIMKY